MYGGIHREDKAEDQKPHDQKNCKPRGGSTRDQRGKGQHERHRHEETGPEDRLVDRLSLGLSFAPQQARCETLHNAAGDDPERHEAADKEKRPRAVPRRSRPTAPPGNRPGCPRRTTHRAPRTGTCAPATGGSRGCPSTASRTSFRRISSARSRPQAETARPRARSPPVPPPCPRRRRRTLQGQAAPHPEKPKPLTAFFDPVETATQRNSPPSSVGASSFTADFDDILARSLATPETPCTAMTKATEAATGQAGSSCARATSAPICSDSPP